MWRSPGRTRVERGIYRQANGKYAATAALPRSAPHLASHLVVDLGLDVAQVSRILGPARITIIDVYAHLFDDARHTGEIRRRMAASRFAPLLDADTGEAPVTMLTHPTRDAQRAWIRMVQNRHLRDRFSRKGGARLVLSPLPSGGGR